MGGGKVGACFKPTSKSKINLFFQIKRVIANKVFKKRGEGYRCFVALEFWGFGYAGEENSLFLYMCSGGGGGGNLTCDGWKEE